MRRSGFTLVELLVAIVIMAILGTILVQTLVRNSRFISQVEASMTARQAARAAMTIMTAELGMVSDSGLTAATAKSVTVRVPYAFGMACSSTGVNLYASLVPMDSLMFTAATASGIAWRDSSGTYRYVTGITVTTANNPAQCTGDSIKTIPGGLAVQIAQGNSIASGRIIYLYENIAYSFEASTSMTGRTGLFRTDGSGTKEELLVPFDTASGFGFLIGSSMTATAAVPGDLNTVRGLQLKLRGESYLDPQGSSEPSEFDLTTSVAFRNKEN